MTAVSLLDRAYQLPNCVFIPLVVFLSIVLLYILHRLTEIPYPPNIPLVREPPGARRFSLRTRLAYYIDCQALFEEAFEKHLKHGQPVVLPGVGVRKEVIVPPSLMRWLLAQPDNKFSVAHGFADVDQATYSLGDEKPIIDGWQGLLVKTDINRTLETICAALNDELSVAFDAHFGKDETDWREIDLREVIGRVIAQANGRFMVGLPLCRSPAYVETVLKQNDLLIAVAGAAGGLPRPVRPFLGTLASIPNRILTRRMQQWLVPLWKKRVATARKELEAGTTQTEQEEDHALMMARFALRERPEEVDDFNLITRRIVANNFGSVHNTTMQVTNLLLNVLGSDAKHGTIAKLVEESESILASAGGTGGTPRWTKSLVSNMVLADSASRETLRLNAFGQRSLFRKIMVDGVETPDGHVLPKGTVLSYLAWSQHTSEETYGADPKAYDPFRFARRREKDAVSEADASEKKTSSQAFVSTGPDYLPFGHGKHACPGRFLIDFEMKMVLSYALRNYHLKFPDRYGGKRPENIWLAEAILPPSGAKICVKRKRLETKR